MSLALASRRAAISPAWVKNPLWRTARAVPSLDLPFADTKILADAVTGQSLVTFTRASSGTYVGSDGLIKTATTNLLLRSEELDNASWTKQNSTATSNQTTAPDGSVAADKLIGNSTIDSHYAQQNISGATNGISYTSSVYAKASEITRIEILHAVGATLYVQGYDLSSGTLLARVTPGTTAATGGFIQAVGNGWYRCGITQTSDGTTGAVRVTLRSANTVSFDATSQGVLIWGAQLEQSSTVGEYIPTTSTINSAPRFDHNPTTGESLGLLVEEQRTNLLLRSEEFDNASWVLFGTASRAANVVLAPNGTQTADSVTLPVAAGIYQLVSGSPGVTYTYSVWIRADSNQTVRLVINTNLGDPTVTTANVSTGWQRYSVTKATSVGTTSITAQLDTGAGATFYLWGAQLEAGSFPTSYIPTTTAAATRSADVASITGAAFSSWYRQDEGTVFVETQFPAGTAVNSSSRSVFDATDGSTNNRVNVRPIGVGVTTDQLTIRSNGSTTAQFSSDGTAVSTSSRRLAAVYKVDDFASWATGATSAATDTSGTLPVGVNQLIIGSTVGATEYLSGTIRRLVFFPQRLANSTLQAITR